MQTLPDGSSGYLSGTGGEVMAIKEAKTRQWVVGVENPSVLLLVLFYSNSYSIWLLTIVFLYWLIEDQVRWALDLPRGI
jgi:hypothetical protein